MPQPSQQSAQYRSRDASVLLDEGGRPRRPRPVLVGLDPDSRLPEGSLDSARVEQPVEALPGSPELRVATSTIAPEFTLAGVTSVLLTIVSAVLLVYAGGSGLMIGVALLCFAASVVMLFTARHRLRAELLREAEREGLSAAHDYARAAELRWSRKRGRATSARSR